MRLSGAAKGLVYAALLGTLAGSGLVGWAAVRDVRDEVSVGRTSFSATVDLYWMENEYYRLREAMAQLAASPADADPAALELRLELLWSRCQLVIESRQQSEIREQFRADLMAAELQAVLDEIEARLPDLAAGDRTALDHAARSLQRFEQPLLQMTVGAEHLLSERSRDTDLRFANVLDRIDIVSFSALGTTIALLLLLAGEAWSARRAVRSTHEREAELAHLAYHDWLTRLPNRRHLVEHLERLTGPANDAQRRQVALLLLDLDGFKPVNDRLGHEAGDRLLTMVAERLTLELRQGDLVARMGGDEFAIVLSTPAAVADVGQLAERLIYVIEQPVDIHGSLVKVSASIGVARFPADSPTPDLLIRNADTALYAAKARGRARMCLFDPRMIEGVERRQIVEDRLRHSIADGQLELFYQPQVQLADGRIDAVEVLLRWQDEQLGPVSPAEFVPIAESIGFIAEIDRWVLAQSIRAAASWEGPCAGLRIAVNLSARQFSQTDLATRVERELVAYGLAPSRLELEITEGAVLNHTSETVAQLQHLRNLGVRVAVDDFGVGYSSLSYLKRLPLDQLKIDRSFIRDIETDPHDRAIVEGIIGLGAALKLEVVAEGIETVAQHEFLAAHGCHRGQGYLFARPMAEAALLEHVAALTQRKGEQGGSLARLPAAELERLGADA